MKTSVSLKLCIIGVLVLLLLIPANMIQVLIRERNENREGVVKEVTDKWGYGQTITGPFLTIPYKVITENNGKVTITNAQAYFLPEILNIYGKLNPEIRHRSIYNVALYNAELNLSGKFNRPDFENMGVPAENIEWDHSYLTVGITDLRGVRKNIEIRWNDCIYAGNPGVRNKQIIDAGITSKIQLSEKDESFKFSFTLNLNGSELIRFIPLGKETFVNLESKWESPGFNGAFLPEERTINPQGFKAKWHILHLNRNYPQQWTSNDEYNVSNSSFGVDLVLPVDHYQKSTRSVKYAILFLFLTFLIFFTNETIHKYRIHPIQYLLIGLSLVIFYVLLVSFSEYIGFNYSYLIASSATILLISLYAYSMIKKKSAALIIGLFLALLYGFLYTLLQLEDYALMLGSIGLFIILAAVMYSSRKINWYAQ